MKQNSTIALSAMVIVLTVGLLGVNGVFTMPSEKANTNLQTGYNTLGHVTLVLKDPNGDIKAYRQTDNVVTYVGRTCTAVMVFGAPSTKQCDQGQNGVDSTTEAIKPFKYIGIGSSGTTETSADTTLNSAISVLARNGYLITNSTATTGGVASESAIFTFPSPNTVFESGIFDSNTAGNAANDHMYAHKALSSSIAVNTGDTLTITWTVTTG